MNITTHNLGFPRIGLQRELKFALEKFWRLEICLTQLKDTADILRKQQWKIQSDSGIDLLPVGDFSLYDHVLDMSVMLGAIPARVKKIAGAAELDSYFLMARGQVPNGSTTQACAMTKWFDTNYHYIVPELEEQQSFELSADPLLAQIEQALQLGYIAKPVLIGPLTWLWLAKGAVNEQDKLALLERLLPVYQQLLNRISALGVEWVQLDEPILVLDLPVAWRNAFETSYHRLQSSQVKILLASYFGGLAENLSLACRLPVAGLHIDLIRAPEQLLPVLDNVYHFKTLSLGIVDGRNIWRCDLVRQLKLIVQAQARCHGRLWLAPSCSLLHVPMDIQAETQLDNEIKPWLAFARQKLEEISALRLAASEGIAAAEAEFDDSSRVQKQRRTSALIHNEAVKQAVANCEDSQLIRHSEFDKRRKKQQDKLGLPLFPTTTIGSFPQTDEIRRIRRDFKQGSLAPEQYLTAIKRFIAEAVQEQEKLGLDVLVHGEPERNDMVEYFAGLLDGFVITAQGWVQSYGSRCVKPPILYGDISRPRDMTVGWLRYARGLTEKPMKGMLTGPVTILNWSFVRDDQVRAVTAQQLALALRGEVLALEKAGIDIIQIDEAALREGLPLRRRDWHDYLQWATDAFRLSSAGVCDETQIHTHMCYSQFNDIIECIAKMDADVISIETSRSHMALLDVFSEYSYPNDIGPGVYDIHSPNVPSVEQIVALLNKARRNIPDRRLWVNPDCGLKTRCWKEVKSALKNMQMAAEKLRREAIEGYRLSP